jgi:hypothetical protein
MKKSSAETEDGENQKSQAPPQDPRTAATRVSQPQQRVFIGEITEVHEGFGLIDGDTFFHTKYIR